MLVLIRYRSFDRRYQSKNLEFGKKTMAAEDRPTSAPSLDPSSSRPNAGDVLSIHSNQGPADENQEQVNKPATKIRLEPAPNLQRQGFKTRSLQLSIFGRGFKWASSIQHECARTELRTYTRTRRDNHSVDTLTRTEVTPSTYFGSRMFQVGTATGGIIDRPNLKYEVGQNYTQTRRFDGPIYLIIGIFSRADSVPSERYVSTENGDSLFRGMFWAIVRLRVRVPFSRSKMLSNSNCIR